MRQKILKIFMLCLCLLNTSISDAQIFVNANASGDNDGTSWEHAYHNLQDALSTANEGNEIWVASGIYLPQNEVEIPSSGIISKTFLLDKDLLIYGSFAGTESAIDERDIENNPTILSGDFDGDDVEDDILINRDDNATNVMFAESMLTNNTILDGLTISGGHADGNTLTENRGGGLYSWGPIQLFNCTFLRNFASASGGGLYFRGETTAGGYVSNCHFEGNAALTGGGLNTNLLSVGDVLVENCTFHANQAIRFGGLEIWNANTTVSNCVFSDNEVSTLGGGIGIEMTATNLENHIVTIENCDFTNNLCGEAGGAIIIDDKSSILESNEISIDQCSFEGNLGIVTGAIAIYKLSNNATISNSTFDNNTGGQNHAIGGGSYLTSSDFDLDIHNCLFTNHAVQGQMQPILGFLNFKGAITNCTFADNESCLIGGQNSGDVRLSNNIFQTSTNFYSLCATDISIEEFFTSEGGNLFTDNTAFSDSTANTILLDVDLVSVSPSFESGTYQLSEESPCVDKGILPDNIPDNDLDGNARIQGSCIDIGAYESSYDAEIECQVLTSNRPELVHESNLTLFPNPVSERTTLLLENDWQGALQIRIINMLGQVQADLMVEKTSTLFQMDLDTQILPKGSYKILISNGAEMAIASFVKS